MTNERWAEVLEVSRRMLVKWGVRDNDLIADTLANYWYAVQFKGRRLSRFQLKKALWRARRYPALPGSMGGHRVPKCRKAVFTLLKSDLAHNPVRRPEHCASVREMVRLLWNRCLNGTERALVDWRLGGFNNLEIAERLGLAHGYVRTAFCHFRKRMQRLYPDQD